RSPSVHAFIIHRKPDRRLSVQKQFTGTRQKNPLRNDPAADFFVFSFVFMPNFPFFLAKVQETMV
ncbi:hypothetical protein, partial [Ruminococcus callidus]|uniref:hypothetical protein n=1 Tax=Ruminococcus callidus TaxID=40519 RepID=UPI003FD85B04